MRDTSTEKPVPSNREREERLLRFLEAFANRLETHFVNLSTEMRWVIRELSRLVGEQQEENTKTQEFYLAGLSAHDKLLNLTSRKLMEQNIHELLVEEEERKRRTKKYTFGGVSPKVLNHE